MRYLKYVALVLSVFTMNAMAYNEDLSYNARVMQYNAKKLYNEVRYLTGYSHISSDLRALVREIADFRATVRSDAARYEIMRQFRDIKRNYRHVLRTMETAHSVHHNRIVQWYLRRLEVSFDALQNSVERYAHGYRRHYRYGYGY